jgi:hypothetical protein
MGTWEPHEVKQTGHEADHLLAPSAKVNYAWSYIPTPLYMFMAWCLIEKGATLLLYKFLYDKGQYIRNALNFVNICYINMIQTI